MDTLSYKTISANKETAQKEWVVVDATDQVLGRLCTKVAKLLGLSQVPSNILLKNGKIVGRNLRMNELKEKIEN